MGKFFGTDGIRGKYGETLTDELAFNIGNAIASLKSNTKVVLGRDTRVSGEQLSEHIIKGVMLGGGEIIDAGIIPTPTIAYITKLLKADYGIVISASHNPPEYNGIKVFDSFGRKLPDSDKNKIEDCLINNRITKADKQGKVEDGSIYGDKYIDAVCELINTSFEGYTVALDCADGASYSIAPKVFTRLGAKVISFNDAGDGSVINCNKGALYPLITAAKVKRLGCDIGFAFDGDADRLIACDRWGRIIDGDLIVYAIGNYLKKRDKLKGNTVVGTHHTNLGVEKALGYNGITLIRTNIGDQYVAEEMLINDYVIGGEQSGHIINREFLDTGDGIWAAAYLMKVMVEEKRAIDRLVKVKLMPQINIGVVIADNKEAVQDPNFVQACEEARTALNGKGRLLVRASGTEPKVRIMVESKDARLARSLGSRLEKILKGEK